MIPRYSLPEMSKIWSEEARFERMLKVELLTCEALARKGAISKTAYRQIKSKARFNIKNISQLESKTRHDVVAFVNDIASKVGKYGRFIHMGLTSSDVLDTALAAGLRQAGFLLKRDLERLMRVFRKQARRYKYTPMVGRTHGVHAEPTTFGIKLALFYDELKRHHMRLERAIDEVSVGKLSGAVGTYANMGPSVEQYVCRKLGLKPAPVSSQVIQRDIHAYFLATLSLIGASIEKIALEVRHLHRTEVKEVEEPFESGQTGSSAMPHKKNPILCERMAGQARLLRGYAQVALENIALWHERDISHSSAERVIIPDSTLLLDYMLQTITYVIENMRVYPENMERNLRLSKGMIFSQALLIRLVKAGLKRKDAYAMVQAIAMGCRQSEEMFEEAVLKSKKIKQYLSPQEIRKCFDVKHNLRFVDYIFRKVGI
ncbi:MAG: adenylosuccinate lyase [Candidatus Omnitrophica bacterium]|nr:adenylosuccinate lyase [Candidatus Omnitrophota bacterium]